MLIKDVTKGRKRGGAGEERGVRRGKGGGEREGVKEEEGWRGRG